ncbi:hypothetical protein Bbelb_014920 [Branchiostoma belcheri]|nr:hypothetical protein Bbelb_014920 [Branchiostoma belcheri]
MTYHATRGRQNLAAISSAFGFGAIKRESGGTCGHGIATRHVINQTNIGCIELRAEATPGIPNISYRHIRPSKAIAITYLPVPTGSFWFHPHNNYAGGDAFVSNSAFRFFRRGCEAVHPAVVGNVGLTGIALPGRRDQG